MTKILVTGSNGQLGSELRQIIKVLPPPEGTAFIFTDSQDLNITDSVALDSYIKTYKISFVINCAAFTAVENAEDPDNKMAAYGLNAGAAGILAKVCKRYDIPLIHVSTDYVFDGKANKPYKEEPATDAVKSVYGESKRLGEVLIEEYCTKYIIIRTSWLYSSYGKNFVKTMLRLAGEKEEISVVNDQRGCPTFARDLALAIYHITFKVLASPDKNFWGIYHYTNAGDCTWYDFAKEIMKIKKLKVKIKPVSSEEYDSKAARPLYSVLDRSKILATFGPSIPNWKDSLRDCLKLL
jgi:dTDP-4-dehydrorhamnose reductase